ncbi:hypothetical protein K2X05_00545 [bacterium]|nr:hypothetical protein [bacterium]
MKITSFVLLINIIASISWACIEAGKRIELKNAPFPFSTFMMTSRSFIYNTPDGQQNSFYCDPNKDSKKMEWRAKVEISRKTLAEFDHKSLVAAQKDQVIYVDDKQAEPKTTIVLGDTPNMAYAVIRRPNHSSQAQIQLECSMDANRVQTMKIKIINNKGQVVSEVLSSHNTSTRSLGDPAQLDGSIDLNSSKQNQLTFQGCLTGQQKQNQKGEPIVK